MGIVNVTPDSFSDGGCYENTASAVDHALSLLEDGADMLDIGGESTRPGADPVSLQEELDRVIPVIEGIRTHTNAPISIDTYKPEVMRASAAVGADMINDINALQAEGAVQTAAESGLFLCLMHKQGTPKTMQTAPNYEHVEDDVVDFLNQRIAICRQAGIPQSKITIDPGIGFGKSLSHNLQLLNAIDSLRTRTASEVLIGVSRKSLIDKLLTRAVDERLPASLGLAVQAALNGARILRIHDVRATYDAVRSVEAVRDQLAD
ncbi:dihydropteroate synthase [Arenicella chitinivorans]|uniref:dihydropteroate synthase n=1 Tax=Arenicella chitinivorans TaxID=1329800 RepID=A0A918RJM4_9GAMM|nr:dihydropteroate synthase [Arenicella chitinivorans]